MLSTGYKILAPIAIAMGGAGSLIAQAPLDPTRDINWVERYGPFGGFLAIIVVLLYFTIPNMMKTHKDVAERMADSHEKGCGRIADEVKSTGDRTNSLLESALAEKWKRDGK